MKATNRTTIDNAFQRDNVIYVHSFGASGIEFKNGGFICPFWSSVFYVLSSVMQFVRTIRVIGPSFASGFINGKLVGLICRLLQKTNAISILRTFLVFFASPFILIFAVFAYVFGRIVAICIESAWLASIANRAAFFVVFGARFIDAAVRASFVRKWNSHKDIIATSGGDVKQGEFGGR